MAAFSMQPKTPDAVLAGLNQHGASIGAKKVCFICLVFKKKFSVPKELYVTRYWYVNQTIVVHILTF